jgi:hypothetical protein
MSHSVLNMTVTARSDVQEQETILRWTRLICANERHHKEYVVELVKKTQVEVSRRGQSETGVWYQVRGKYGRIGSSLASIWKTPPVSHAMAVNSYNRLVAEKETGGYRIDFGYGGQIRDPEPSTTVLPAPPAPPARQTRAAPARPAAASEDPPVDRRRLRL